MRKVKFTQDSFDEKLGAILEEFPMLDVRVHLVVITSFSESDDAGPTSLPCFPHERALRQKPLQTRPWSTQNSATLDRPSRQRLCPLAQVR